MPWSSTPPLILFALAVGLPGLALLVLALRGRWINTPPRCARCAFDLSGLQDAGLCPECGASLGDPRAVLTSRRKIRRRALALALPLLLIGAGAASLHVARAVYKLDWIHFAPASFLLQELGSPTPERAATELSRRIGANSLNPADRAKFRAALLARLEDPSATWPAPVQDALWAEYESGQMSEAERERYELAGLRDFKITVRPRVRKGATIAVKESWSRVRIGPSQPEFGRGLDARIRTPTPMIFREGVNLSDPALQQSYGESSGMLDPTSRSTYATAARPIHELGPHEIRVNVTAWFKPQSDRLDFSPPRQITLIAKFDVVEGEAILPLGPTPEALAPGVVARALWVRLEVGATGTPSDLNAAVVFRWERDLGPLSHRVRISPARNGTGIDLPTIDADGLTTPRTNGAIESRGDVTDARWREAAAKLADPTPRGFDSRRDTPTAQLTVDVVLEPDPARAEKSSEVDAYRNVRLTFRNVPVFVYRTNGARTESWDKFESAPIAEVQWLNEPSATPSSPKP
ncbi:MAG: hypothetical protein SFY95_01450 [Planctomycetota bacterium]|nr:hypothetical protein [Planctomycetota bacterium]